MKRVLQWTVAVMAALLLAGCGGQQPVSGAGSTPTATATPSPALSVSASASALSGTQSPASAPASLIAYSFPMAASGLFGSAGTPAGFATPLFFSPDASMFLYATSDGRILKETWNPTGYSQSPVAEGVEAGIGASFYLDASKSRLCCAGSKLYAGDRPGPAVVIVDMATGARCNADELCAWKKEKGALSDKFQYCGGTILAQVLLYGDETYAPADQWAVLNVDGKTSSTLDMSDLISRFLPDWQDMVSYRLALTARDRLLAVCLAQRQDSSTGTQEFGCFALQMDLKGRVLGSVEASAKDKKPLDLALPQAQLFHASQDGMYLLYTDERGTGVYLYDTQSGAEYEITGTDGRACAFAQWGSGGVVYYGVGGKQSNGQITILKTSVSEIEKQ